MSFCSLCLNASLLKNGDFEKGSSGWKGDRRVTYEDSSQSNRVCKVEVKSKEQEFYQEVKSKNLRELKLNFDVKKSSDYDGGDFSVRFVRDNGSYTFWDSSVNSASFSKKTYKFQDIKGSKKIKVTL